MDAVKPANLAVRFLLELCVVAALAYWGVQVGNGPLAKIVLAVGAPLVVAVIWAVFGSPKAAVPLSGPAHLLLEIVVFGAGVVALVYAGRPTLAAVLAAVIIVNRALLYLWRQ